MVASLTRRLEVNTLAQFDTKHLSDWIDESGVSPEITKLNIESLTREEVNERVRPKHPIKTGGWWCRGVNWQNGQPMDHRYGQVKPDEKHFDPDKPNDKGAKYLTASGMTPDAIFLAMPDPDYWRKVYEDKSIPIIWTEGAKKAGAGLTHGFATIALTGVFNWGKGFKLAPLVKLFLERGGDQYLAFDSDYRKKPQCREAIRRFCNLAEMLGITLKIITWDSSYKGMDDYLKEKGAAALEYQKFLSENLKNWEKQLNKDLASQNKPPTPRETAQEITEDYRPNWRYHNEQKTWRYWNGKCWESVDDGVFRSTVKIDIDGKGVNYSKADYISNVVSLMTDDLRVPKWKSLERYKYIPFDNGVVETATGKLRKHSPDDGFTHVLPHKYKLVKTDDLLETLKRSCPDTYQYMAIAQQNNKLMIKKMLAAVNGVITGKFSQLQLFLQLIGKTRAGKGTFTRLLKECVGAANHASASLKDLHKPEIRASIIDKMLVEFPEQRSTNDEALGWLLALTGGDSISCKRLYKDPTSEKFDGCPVITSNRQIGTARFPELDERLCLITFDHTVPKDKRIPNLDQLIKAEIPELIAIALSMSDTEVTQLLKGVGEGDNPAVKLHQWELKTEESVVAAFFNDVLIVEPGIETRTKDLYKIFRDYCSERGKNPYEDRRFARELSELCEHLELEDVRWKKRGGGKNPSQFEGLRLRTVNDNHLTHEEILGEKIQEVPPTLPGTPPRQSPPETPSTQAFPSCTPSSDQTFSFNDTQSTNSENSQKTDSPPPEPDSKAAPKPELIRPRIANLTDSQKEEWLHRYHKTDKEVWVECPRYTGWAKPRHPSFGKEWYMDATCGPKIALHEVKLDQIFISQSQLGNKIKPKSESIGEQTELNFSQTQKAETPKQRFKRLAKEQGIKLTPNDFDYSYLLDKYQKSDWKKLTDGELTEIADLWESQIEQAKRDQEKNRITKNLEK